MEANSSEVKKLDLFLLPLVHRRELLDVLSESLRPAADHLDIAALKKGISNLKASLD
jgi:hypothetical protein